MSNNYYRSVSKILAFAFKLFPAGSFDSHGSGTSVLWIAAKQVVINIIQKTRKFIMVQGMLESSCNRIGELRSGPMPNVWLLLRSLILRIACRVNLETFVPQA